MGAGYIAMNKDKWNTIPPDAQKIIEEINEEYTERISNLWLEIVEDGYEFHAQKGGKRNILSKKENARWNKALMDVTHAYVKELNSQGLPGDEVYKFAMDYLKTH